MQLKQISEWVNKDDMEVLLSDEEIKSWLLEKGPITKRIKLNHNFELNLIRDEVDQINQDDKVFLDNIEGDIKVREVILLGNGNPLVYAKSYIPVFTITVPLEDSLPSFRLNSSFLHSSCVRLDLTDEAFMPINSKW